MTHRSYGYLERYDGHYHDGDYYERRGNYDEGSRFTPSLDIPNNNPEILFS